MNYFKEKKIAFWTIVILIVLNVSTLTTIWLHRPPRPFPHPPRSGKFIPDFVIAELKLNAIQKEAFEKSEQQQMKKIIPLLDSLHLCKQQLFLSSFEDVIDSTKTNILIQKIGTIAEKIDIITFSHILELKKVCNHQQQDILKNLFRDMGEVELSKRVSAPQP